MNRSGPEGFRLSHKDDVLFNTSDDPRHKGIVKFDQAVVPLRIAELNAQKEYYKVQTHSKVVNGNKEEHTCAIHLKHKVEECMYCHCAFEIYYDQEEVTYKNYDDTIGSNKSLRTWAKNEIAKMILKEEVRMNWDVPDLVSTEVQESAPAPTPHLTGMQYVLVKLHALWNLLRMALGLKKKD